MIKLTYKLYLVTIFLMTAMGLSIAIISFSSMGKMTYSFTRQLMSQEVGNIIAILQNSAATLEEQKAKGNETSEQKVQEEILKRFTNYRFQHTGELMIVTSQGLVVKHATLSPGQPADFDKVANMIKYGSGALEFRHEGEFRFFRFKHFPTWDWLVILSVDRSEILAPRVQFLKNIMTTLTVCLLVGGIASFFLIKRIVSRTQ